MALSASGALVVAKRLFEGEDVILSQLVPVKLALLHLVGDTLGFNRGHWPRAKVDAIAKAWERALIAHLSTPHCPAKITVEVDYTEEGDWSLSWEHGSHTYALHPTDETYRQFVVLLHKHDETEVFLGPCSLEVAIGNVERREHG
jgi:hypothetical protein